MDLSLTASSVKPSATGYRYLGNFLAAEAIAAGQLLYKYSATQVKLAKNDGTADEKVLFGMAMQSVASGQSVEVGVGKITINSVATVGEIYLLSSNYGGVMPADDLGSGDTTSIAGFGALATELDIQPLNSGYAIA